MVLIFSKLSDQSTNDVVRLLINRGQPFIRINEDTKVEFSISIVESSKSYIVVEGKKTLFSSINSVWVRKGAFFKSLRYPSIQSFEIAEFILNEERVLYSLFSEQFDSKRLLNSFEEIHFNKIRALHKAYNVGISVPKGIILNSINALKDTMKKMDVITKPLFNIIDPTSNLSMLTRKIDLDDVNKMPALFYPSLIQEYVRTIYEIRTVYLLDEFYSCVLVPRHKTTNLPDYRGSKFGDLGLEPITISNALQQKLRKLMKKLNLKFCSLDLLVDGKEKYYLVDINPFGQYGMVSIKYDGIIDNKIAKYLSNE